MALADSRIIFGSLLWTLAVMASGEGLATATGKIPLEGALSASQPSPAVGQVALLYFNATPLAAAPRLTLRVELPEGLGAAGGASEQSFSSVAPGQTVTLALPVRVLRPGPQEVRATVFLIRTESLQQSRVFVLTLSLAAPPPSQAKEGTDRKGHALILYGGEDKPPPSSAHPPTPL